MIFIAEEIDTGVRLDSFIAKRAGISRSAAARLAEEGEITLFGKSVGKKYLLRAGDEICLTVPEAREAEVMPENIPLDIIYEDSDIAVINKPSGMVVHPAAGNPSGTLVNALLYHCKGSLSGIGGVMRPGIVHRIDKDTSGLLVIAKNDEAHVKLSRELEHHGIVREYHALARGGFPTDSGTVSVPIGRHPIDRKRMAPHPDTSRGAKEAVTHYSVIARYGEVSYLKLLLETGRTHQIRVHMAHIGHALLGDEVYARNKIRFEKQHAPLFDGQMLHAKRLTLTHPRSGERMSFDSPLPENFLEALRILDGENQI